MSTNPGTRRHVWVRKANLRAAAEDLGIETDKAIASTLGVHPSTMSLLMNRHLEPNRPVIAAAIDELKRPFEHLFEIERVLADEVAA